MHQNRINGWYVMITYQPFIYQPYNTSLPILILLTWLYAHYNYYTYFVCIPLLSIIDVKQFEKSQKTNKIL